MKWTVCHGQNGLGLGHVQKLGQGLVTTRYHSVHQGFATIEINMFKETCFALKSPFSMTEWKALHPIFLQGEFIELANVHESLAGSVTCQLARNQAVVSVGSDKLLGIAAIHVSPVKIMSLQEAKKIVQGSLGTRPGLLRANNPKKEVMAEELVGEDAALRRVPQQNRTLDKVGPRSRILMAHTSSIFILSSADYYVTLSAWTV
ncbi:hypothetical protein [Pseudomonas sp. 2822-17]|uniref:hypothetical protein n=1 Tax=Pseudomonas TaxID=286 RepID=UPI000C1460EC|nr:hypothetical protein [Pseudomonas sp. 2822-17]PIB66791.1 hypothetical protein AOA60_01195 [Pseudomonas sp. 2822-17]